MGIQCDACYRACPLLGEAISIEYSKMKKNRKTHFKTSCSFTDVCTGCGLCEKACVTQKAAILFLPRNVALVVAGDIIFKVGIKDEKKVENATSSSTKTKLSKDSAVDSLNSSKDMEDLLNDKKYRFLIIRKSYTNRYYGFVCYCKCIWNKYF